jgi:hypothetical protein
MLRLHLRVVVIHCENQRMHINRNPTIPMSPAQRAKQRIVPVANLRARPVPADAFVSWDEKSDGVRLLRGLKYG